MRATPAEILERDAIDFITADAAERFTDSFDAVPAGVANGAAERLVEDLVATSALRFEEDANDGVG